MCLLTQLCPTLYDPKDCSPPGSSVHGIFQARVLEWVAIAFSKELHYTERKKVPGIWQALLIYYLSRPQFPHV